MSVKLDEKAVLMRLSVGLPGEERHDPGLTKDVKREHSMGSQSGKWVKTLYPPEALKAVKKLDNEARAYHAAVTLPFDTGIGILPAPLIMEYGDRMRQFAGMRQALINEFLADPQKWVDWAVKEHNGTFSPEPYPGCIKSEMGVTVDAVEFRAVMKERFYFGTEPLPVPDSTHFQTTVKSLLGVDAESVDTRVNDAMEEARRELFRRMMAPVKAMAVKLSEAPKEGKDCPTFRDTLVENIKDIAKLAPKLNITGDTVIEDFVKQMESLAGYSPETLRKNGADRKCAADEAAAVLKRMEAYKL